MITAVRIVTPSEMTLSTHTRTKSGRFRTGDGAVDLVDLLLSLRGSGMQARIEVECAQFPESKIVTLDVFEGIAIRPAAAVHLAEEVSAAELQRSHLLVQIDLARTEHMVEAEAAATDC